MFSIHCLCFSMFCFRSLDAFSFPYSSFWNIPLVSFDHCDLQDIANSCWSFWRGGLHRWGESTAINGGKCWKQWSSSNFKPQFSSIHCSRRLSRTFCTSSILFAFLAITCASNWTNSTFLSSAGNLKRIITAFFEKNWTLTLILDFFHFYVLQELFEPL
jgi:hypothetical protein